MLTLTIFLPLLVALVILALPQRAARVAALVGTGVVAALTAVLAVGYRVGGEALQWREQHDWIPAVGASYDVAVTGVSLPLILLTALLMLLVALYKLPDGDKARTHAFLFLLMETGLLGVFCAQDLLLFYLFFEIALVPMYFIVGVFGHEERRYAAVKFFLYTRAGSLAMLLSFLALAIGAGTFSLPAIIAMQPVTGATAGLVLLGLVIGFGVKLPILPLHNWLPDAHVEAPTEGSVILAGVQLKLGAYGLIAVLPTVAEAARAWSPLLLGLGVATLLYGVLAALGQSDFKRLVAYSSINHMAFVLIGVAAAYLATDPGVRALALNGATLQAVSHGLLTAGMFFMVGMLRNRAGTRDLSELTGVLRGRSGWSGLLALLAFGSLGLPGLSGFIAEFQVIGATIPVSPLAAGLTVLGLILTTGLYLKVVVTLLLSEDPEQRELPGLGSLEWAALAPLVALSILIGVLPGPLLALIESTTRGLT